VVIVFIDEHKDRFGVEPICRVLSEHGCHPPRGLLAGIEERDQDIETQLREAIRAFTTLGYPYWLARTRQDLASWLSSHDHLDEAERLNADAAGTFAELGIALRTTKSG
jgi:hypothetical protein